ncbi:MAG: response regulator [Rhodanobacter sp.]
MGSPQKSILIIEDDAIVTMIVEDMLLDMHVRVLTSSTLENALFDIENETFDAAIVDMHLRGESAMPAIELLQARKLPFLVLSGNDQSPFRASHPQVVMMGKPFDKAELEDAVRALLGV